MTKPAFESAVRRLVAHLTGQINRKHYYFAVDSKNRFRDSWLGVTLKEKPRPGSKAAAPCASRTAGTALPDLQRLGGGHARGEPLPGLAGREIIQGKDTVYFKRHYKDGSTRPVRLRVNDFVAQHLTRQKGGAPAAELAPA